MSNQTTPEYEKYKVFVTFLKRAGIDHIKNGSITLHFDRYGNCKAVKTEVTQYVASGNE